MLPIFEIEVESYQDENGRRPYDGWLEGIDRHARRRVREKIERFCDGNKGNIESVGDGVYEIKIDFGPGYRVYFGWEVNDKFAILLIGGTKKGQARDIDNSKRFWAAYKERKKER